MSAEPKASQGCLTNINATEGPYSLSVHNVFQILNGLKARVCFEWELCTNGEWFYYFQWLLPSWYIHGCCVVFSIIW